MKLEDAIKSNKFSSALHKATINLMYTNYWMKTHVSAIHKDNGITMEQFNVMRILKGKHPEQMCVKDIGSRMIEKSSNVPRIIDRLLVKKLVKRTTSKEDKRETLITLTEKGINTLEEANKKLLETNDRILGLDEKEAKQLNDLLEKLRKVD